MYPRTLQVDYSQPLGNCLHEIGEFHVNYTIQTQWTQPPFIRVQRRVIVEATDVCSLPDIAAGTAACITACYYMLHELVNSLNNS
jgi:hypothetical protein